MSYPTTTYPTQPQPTHSAPRRHRVRKALLIAAYPVLAIASCGIGAGMGSSTPTATAAQPAVTVTATQTVTAPPTTAAAAPKPTHTAAPKPAPKPKAVIPDGYTVVVGEDVPAGTYQTRSTSDQCYWEVDKKSGGIDKNDFGAKGHIVVTMKNGESFSSGDCGDWTQK